MIMVRTAPGAVDRKASIEVMSFRHQYDIMI